MQGDQKFVPIDYAAKTLNCSTERVHELCDQGLIRRHNEGDICYVREDDVAEVRCLNVYDEMDHGELVRRLVMLEAQVQRLEAAVDKLFTVNDIASSPLIGMEDNELLHLYVVVHGMRAESQDLDTLEGIVEVMMQLTETEISRINELQDSTDTWLSFMELCVDTTRRVVSSPDLATNLQLQRINAKLVMARKNLATIATFFITKTGGVPDGERLAKMGMYDLEAFDVVAVSQNRDATFTLV